MFSVDICCCASCVNVCVKVLAKAGSFALSRASISDNLSEAVSADQGNGFDMALLLEWVIIVKVTWCM